jgi:ribokinase
MITVLGSNSLDFIGAVSRFPGPGETVLGGSFAMAPGGKGANQALAARRAGAEVRMIAATGSDPFGPEALKLLREGGVELVLKTAPTATGIAMILVEQSGENAIAVLPGANATLGVAEAEAALAGLGIGSILMLQQEIPHVANARALELAREQGVVSILNTAPYLESTGRLAELASIVVANETEFALLSGAGPDRLEVAMAEWAAAQNQTVIVTLGADGARAATTSSGFCVTSPRIMPVDTVGAGDTFCGYLAAGLDRGLGLEAAMRRATVAASLACLVPGAQPAIPLAEDVELALAKA